MCQASFKPRSPAGSPGRRSQSLAGWEKTTSNIAKGTCNTQTLHGTYAYIGVVLGVNVGIYCIHGVSGLWKVHVKRMSQLYIRQVHDLILLELVIQVHTIQEGKGPGFTGSLDL